MIVERWLMVTKDGMMMEVDKLLIGGRRPALTVVASS